MISSQDLTVLLDTKKGMIMLGKYINGQYYSERDHSRVAKERKTASKKNL